MNIRILYRNDESGLLIADKPAGMYTHPPENLQSPLPKRLNFLALLRDQIGMKIFPVHRLDRATSGCLMVALNSAQAANLNLQIQQNKIKKTYLALVRGFVDHEGLIESPLKDDNGIEKSAITRFLKIQQVELKKEVGKFPTLRASLVLVQTETGRYHQIRRHFKKISHPLIGDTVYGDGKHSRAWAELIQASRIPLCLHAYLLNVDTETTNSFQVRAKFPSFWHSIFDQIGTCPFPIANSKTLVKP